MIPLTVLVLASAASVRVAMHAGTRSAARARVAREHPGPTLAPTLRQMAAPLLRGRRDRLVERSLPELLDAIARSLRSGSSLRQAVAEAAMSATGPIGDDLVRVAGSLEDGAPLADALDRWRAACPLPGVRLAVAALTLGAETGGASARAVDGVAATLRSNLAIAGEVRALSSQARLSALVIALAPVAFSFLAVTADRSTLAFLLGTPFGLTCLTVGVALDAIGWIWMRRLTLVAV